MNYPEELKYAKSHEWLKEEGNTVVIGISDFAQDALGDIVFVNLPEEGDEVTAGEAFADVESVKAVSDIFSPVTGTVVSVNEEIMDDPALINGAPYDSWFIKVENVTEHRDLLDAAAYEAHATAEAGA
ncbi:MAG: glycine cleavage system protein GcvH [Clostridiales bacterium]|nr:glycine cleavage system protein GcvH [Clostridiales bacterium]